MRRVESTCLVLALGFYVWFVTHFGEAQVWGYVRLAGWGLALTVWMEAAARVANTLGWSVTLGRYRPCVSFGELFAARIAGEAVDYVTPSAQLGGQFVMALMVRRKLKMAAGLSTALAAALCEMVGQIIFVALALVFSIRLVPVARQFLWPILGGFLLASALAAGFFFVQTKRPFSYLLRAASALPGIQRDEYRGAADEADRMLLDFYMRHRARVMVSCFWYIAAWSLGPVEIYILLKLLGQPAGVEVVLLVEALGLLIERAAFLIPAKLVSQEGGKALIFALLGYPAGVGFAIGLLRRVKEMIWVLFGLASLTIHRLSGASETLEARGLEEMAPLERAQGEEPL